MSAASVEACTKSITVLEPFTLDCGHKPDPVFRGLKVIGDRMPCVECYRAATGPVPQIKYTVCRPDKAHNKPCGAVKGDPDACACGCRSDGTHCEAEIKRIAAKEAAKAREDAAGQSLESLGFVFVDHPKEEDMSTAMTPAPALVPALAPVLAPTTAIARVFTQEQATQLVTTTQQYKVEAEAVLAQFRGVEVTTVESQTWAAETCKVVKQRIAEIDGWRTTLVRPMLDEKTGVDACFAPSLAAFRELEKILKQRLFAFEQRQKAAQEAAMQASSAQYAAGGMPTNPIPVVAHAQGVSIRTQWSFRIYDESLVPREFCSPSPGKIQIARGMDMADTSKEPRPIPGVMFYIDGQVAVRK